MARKKSTSYFDRITHLLEQRDYHTRAMNAAAGALNEVNKVLERISSALGTPAKGKAGRGRPPGSGKRTRKTFAMSGEAAILAFVKKAGNPTTRDVEKFWKSQGRGGSAANALGKLTREKKLKRAAVKDGRGSTYSVE